MMVRTWLIVVLAVAAEVSCGTGQNAGGGFSPQQSGPAPLRLDQGDSGRTVGVAVGSSFIISLPVDPTVASPVGWSLITPPDPSIADVSGNRSGSGVQLWTFRAVGPGTTTLELEPPGQGATITEAATFRLIVSVT